MTESNAPEKKASTTLPVADREALIAASKIRDEFKRMVAIEAARTMARSRNPHLFKQEAE